MLPKIEPRMTSQWRMGALTSCLSADLQKAVDAELPRAAADGMRKLCLLTLQCRRFAGCNLTTLLKRPAFQPCNGIVGMLHRAAPFPVSTGLSFRDLPASTLKEVIKCCQHYEEKATKYGNHLPKR